MPNRLKFKGTLSFWTHFTHDKCQRLTVFLFLFEKCKTVCGCVCGWEGWTEKESNAQTVKRRKEKKRWRAKSDERERTTALDTCSKAFCRASAMRKRWLTLAEDQLIGGVSFIAVPTSLSVSDCTIVPRSFSTTTTTGSACSEAVLDTNLSSVNKSQAHQPECYSWQPAPVGYERQIVQWGQRTARGILQQPLEWLVNIMFAFYYCYILLLPVLDLVILIGLIKDQRNPSPPPHLSKRLI